MRWAAWVGTSGVLGLAAWVAARRLRTDASMRRALVALADKQDRLLTEMRNQLKRQNEQLTAQHVLIDAQADRIEHQHRQIGALRERLISADPAAVARRALDPIARN